MPSHNQPPSSSPQVCAQRVIQGILNILCVSRLGPRRFAFTLTKVNTNPFPVILEYRTTQRFDFSVISVATGREVWRWSFDRVFAQVIERIRLEPGETTSQTVIWPGTDNFGRPVPPGRYRVRGQNLATVRRVFGTGSDDNVDITPFVAMSDMPKLDADLEISDSSQGSAAPMQAAPKTASSAAPLASNTMHTIRPGDSLWKIAQQYGTTIKQLQALNGISNPDTLKVGQKIKIR